MNQLELERKLIAAARTVQPSDQVPFTFEKRVMARLASVPRHDGWSAWAYALPRAAVFCLAIMLSLTAWTYLGGGSNSAGIDLSQDMANTVLAVVDQEPAPDTAW